MIQLVPLCACLSACRPACRPSDKLQLATHHQNQFSLGSPLASCPPAFLLSLVRPFLAWHPASPPGYRPIHLLHRGGSLPQRDSLVNRLNSHWSSLRLVPWLLIRKYNGSSYTACLCVLSLVLWGARGANLPQSELPRRSASWMLLQFMSLCRGL